MLSAEFWWRLSGFVRAFSICAARTVLRFGFHSSGSSLLSFRFHVKAMQKRTSLLYEIGTMLRTLYSLLNDSSPCACTALNDSSRKSASNGMDKKGTPRSRAKFPSVAPGPISAFSSGSILANSCCDADSVFWLISFRTLAQRAARAVSFTSSVVEAATWFETVSSLRHKKHASNSAAPSALRFMAGLH